MRELRIVKLNLLHWKSDPKYLTAILYLLLYSYDRLHGLVDYAASLENPISPWVLPFMPCMGASFLPIMLGFVLLISDAPFRTSQQQFVMQRTGKRAWITGQLLYILAVSFGFALIMWVLSWIWLIPQLKWNSDWGSVLRTATMNGVPGVFHVYVEFPYSIVKNTNPITVTLWCLGTISMVCFLLGVIMAACNLWLRKGWGAFLIAALTAISLILDHSAQNPGPIRFILWLSPLNWMDYSLMGHSEQFLPSHAYGILCPALLGLGLSILLILTIGKCNVETDKE